MFMHGGWMHLIGNMWFLWIYGDNVEDVLGHGKYLLFYLLCGMAAGAAFTSCLRPDSGSRRLGASGAIAGVMGAYLIKFPHSRIITLVPVFVFLTTMEIPAVFMLLYWFVIQIFSGVGSDWLLERFARWRGLVCAHRRICCGHDPGLRDGNSRAIPASQGPAMVDLLAIAAHPDDVEQTCGGTLLRMAEAGYRTGVIDLTAGEMGSRGTPETRIEEAESAAAILKLVPSQQHAVSRHQARQLGRVPGAARARRSAALRPRTVILPYWEARHPDHYHAVGIALRCVLSRGTPEARSGHASLAGRSMSSTRRCMPT